MMKSSFSIQSTFSCIILVFLLIHVPGNAMVLKRNVDESNLTEYLTLDRRIKGNQEKRGKSSASYGENTGYALATEKFLHDYGDGDYAASPQAQAKTLQPESSPISTGTGSNGAKALVNPQNADPYANMPSGTSGYHYIDEPMT